jgi:acyl-coenzyme A synthetase/AMP-(fatty) acid ligase
MVIGRDDQFVRRGEIEVNLHDLEAVLRRVVGVKEARVVGFPHVREGKELGAFVLLHKKAQVTREVLWSNLLAFFPWELVPKVFMLADASLVPVMPARVEIEDKLAKFSSSDFARPPKL